MEHLYVSGVFTALKKHTYIAVNKNALAKDIVGFKLRSIIVKNSKMSYIILLTTLGSGRPISMSETDDNIRLNMRQFHLLSKDDAAQIKLSDYRKYGSIVSFEIKSNIQIKEINLSKPFFSRDARLHVPRLYFPRSSTLYFQWIVQAFNPPRVLIEISDKKSSMRMNLMSTVRCYFRSTGAFRNSDKIIYSKIGRSLNDFELKEIILHDKHNFNFILGVPDGKET